MCAFIEWSEAEIIQLLDLIIERGQNWTHIQKVLVHRSMHCIKSKGRKLLGETVNKRLSKASKLKGVRKEWFPEEVEKLMELHKRFGFDLQSICYELKTGRPTAQADRKILGLCRCDKCKARVQKLKAMGPDFKLAWTQQKAREVKAALLAQGLKNGGALPSALINSPDLQACAITEIDVDSEVCAQIAEPEVEVETQAPKEVYRLTLNQSQRDLDDELIIDSERNLPQMPFYKEMLPPSSKAGLKSYDSLLTPLGLDMTRSHMSKEAMEPRKAMIGPRRGVKRSYGSGMDEEEQGDQEDALIKKTRGNELFAMLDKALSEADFDINLLDDSLNLDFTSFESLTQNLDKEQQDSVMSLILQTARRARMSKSKKLSQNIARFFADYFSEHDLQTLSVHMRQEGIEFFNPSICFILDSITPNNTDPRYSRDYLSPESTAVAFDRMRPTGAYVVNLATRMFMDSDRGSLQIARGNVRGKHSWVFVPSRVEALLRVYYIMPKLLKTGQAWSHVRMHRCDGTEGVFLCQYKLINNGADFLVRFQDVSDRFQHVLELPPDLW